MTPNTWIVNDSLIILFMFMPGTVFETKKVFLLSIHVHLDSLDNTQHLNRIWLQAHLMGMMKCMFIRWIKISFILIVMECLCMLIGWILVFIDGFLFMQVILWYRLKFVFLIWYYCILNYVHILINGWCWNFKLLISSKSNNRYPLCIVIFSIYEKKLKTHIMIITSGGQITRLSLILSRLDFGFVCTW